MGRMTLKREPRYHHGDLRAALLDAAVAVIAERGAHGLSLRECARRAGVSHAAPYRHFADKDALLLAIARQGYQWLHEAGVASMEGLDDPRERFDAYGVAYVRFALQHPVHVRVMFTLQFEIPEHERNGGTDAFDLLQETAAAVVGPDHDSLVAAVAGWALPHGLSMLILDGRIAPERIADEAAVEKLARDIYEMWRGPLSR